MYMSGTGHVQPVVSRPRPFLNQPNIYTKHVKMIPVPVKLSLENV